MKNKNIAGTVARAFAAWVVLAAFTAGVTTRVPAAAEEASAKGMYVSQDAKGVKFNVLLNRANSEEMVSSGHRFISGDRLRFQFEINDPSWVYVVHRELKGHPASKSLSRHAGTKGILFTFDTGAPRQEPSSSKPRSESSPPTRVTRYSPAQAEPVKYKLLFPNSKTGLNNKLPAGRSQPVPWVDDHYFTLDENPGIEKLYLVVSPRRLGDLEAMFNEGDGEFIEQGDERSLTAILAQYSDNGNVSIGKGITIDSYGVGVDSKQPFMTEVDLAHYPSGSAGSNE